MTTSSQLLVQPRRRDVFLGLGPQAPLEAPVEDASNEKGVPCSARLQITLCRTAGVRAAGPSEVLPLAVAIAPFNGVTVVGACADA